MHPELKKKLDELEKCMAYKDHVSNHEHSTVRPFTEERAEDIRRDNFSYLLYLLHYEVRSLPGETYLDLVDCLQSPNVTIPYSPLLKRLYKQEFHKIYHDSRADSSKQEFARTAYLILRRNIKHTHILNATLGGRIEPHELKPKERKKLEKKATSIVGMEYKLGWRFEMGKGAPKDSSEAAKWYERAADHGYGETQNNLARIIAKEKKLDEPVEFSAEEQRICQQLRQRMSELGCLVDEMDDPSKPSYVNRHNISDAQLLTLSMTRGGLIEGSETTSEIRPSTIDIDLLRTVVAETNREKSIEAQTTSNKCVAK